MRGGVLGGIRSKRPEDGIVGNSSPDTGFEGRIRDSPR